MLWQKIIANYGTFFAHYGRKLLQITTKEHFPQW